MVLQGGFPNEGDDKGQHQGIIFVDYVEGQGHWFGECPVYVLRGPPPRIIFVDSVDGRDIGSGLLRLLHSKDVWIKVKA